MNAAGRRRLTPPLAIAVALLGLLYLAFLAGLGRGVHWAPPRAPAPLPPRQDAKLPAPVPLQQYAAVWQQPLFSPDRKPTARAASGSSQLGDLQLTGIMLMPGLRMALLHDRRGKELRVREGDTLPDGSTTLVELRPRSAVFDASSGRVELKLPAGAPIEEAHRPPPEPGAEAGQPAPEDSHRQLLDPESVKIGGEGQSKDDSAQPDQSPDDAVPEDQAPGESGSAPPPQGPNAASRQAAERLRLLRAAIQRRRAAEAAAAQKGDR